MKKGPGHFGSGINRLNWFCRGFAELFFWEGCSGQLL